MRQNWQEPLRDWLAETLGTAYQAVRFRPSGTGCINDTWEAYGDGLASLFIKSGPAASFTLYQRETEGLAALRRCGAIRVPQVLGGQRFDEAAVLVLEFIELTSVGAGDANRIADALAQLHDITGPAFGFEHDNFIGRTPQVNQYHPDWWTFWCECRLRPQWRLAQLKGMRPALLARLEQLIEQVPARFGDHQPRASLLHGDLWSGNLAVDAQGQLCLFDPAVYFGDAETDIAMSRMFGALRPAVYERYHQHHPLRSGAGERRVLYDLYHWLNHFNLFGVTYLGQVENSVDALLNGK